jgi:very-short-patch-repair endonuclease
VLDDEIRKEIFEEEGYTVIFVWEHEINSEDFDTSQLLNKHLLAA